METLHEQAASTFNKTANNLFERIAPAPPRNDPPDASHDTDTHVVDNLGKDQIVADSFRTFTEDHTGARRSCYFFVPDRGMVGLASADHEELSRLSRSITNTSCYRDSLSHEFVYQQCVDWLALMAKNTGDRSVPSLTDFLACSAKLAIRNYEIWIPIPIASISHPFTIGGVVFRRITREMMNGWADSSNANSSPKSQFVFDRLRSRIQAATAACVAVEAEPIKAHQIARTESINSIAVFRLACPAILTFYKWAPIDLSEPYRNWDGQIFLEIQDGQIGNIHGYIRVSQNVELI